MARRAPLHDLALHPRGAGQSVQRWLEKELRIAILEGRLRSGSRLPSTRQLARQHGLARGTVVGAFAQLEAEGYIESRQGAGSFVARRLPDEWFKVAPTEQRLAVHAASARPALSEFSRRIVATGNWWSRPNRQVTVFRTGEPALDAFPIDLWSRLAARRLRLASRTLLGTGDPRGYLPLREAIAGYLGSVRGVRCSPEEVLIVSGTQRSLDLVARVILDPGDAVWMEDPGYPGAVVAFNAAGAHLNYVPVDTKGLDVSFAQRHFPGAKLIYVTPAHQFPIGTVLSLERRLKLLHWAHQNGAFVFEDDYDSEFRYAGRPLAALQGLDAKADCRVIHAGSFNKMLFPALRLGYLVVPPSLAEAIATAKLWMDRFPPLLDQAILYDFIEQGHFRHHLRRMRELYAERREALLESGRDRLEGLLDIEPVDTGIETIGWLAGGIDDMAAARSASAHGIYVSPISQLFHRQLRRAGLLLGFASAAPKAIRAGVDRLAIVLAGLLKDRRPRPTEGVALREIQNVRH